MFEAGRASKYKTVGDTDMLLCIRYLYHFVKWRGRKNDYMVLDLINILYFYVVKQYEMIVSSMYDKKW